MILDAVRESGVAAKAGFRAPILHGLASFGIAARAAIALNNGRAVIDF